MKVTADRIENGFIVAELPDGSFADLPQCFAPQAREGDIINIDVDAAATAERGAQMRARLNRLFDREG